MEIARQSDRWVVMLDWSEVDEAYESETPVERALRAVAAREDTVTDRLHSSIIRVHEDGQTIVITFPDRTQ